MENPLVTPQVIETVSEPLYRPFVAYTLAKIPDEFHPTILTEYADRSPDGANPKANEWLRESVGATFEGAGLPVNANDDDISRYADKKSKIISDLLANQMFTTPESVIYLIEEICANAGIHALSQKSLESKIQRVCDPKWWRKRLKKDLMQKREAGAIKLGLVHSKAGLYLSNHGLDRYRQSNKRSLEYLQSMEVVNELGEVLDLAEIYDSNVSNPKIRFVEMVIRAKGLEDYANQLGYVGIFATQTCPSRMHARHSESGRRNCKYDGTTPKEAHQYLGKQWAKARAAFKREGINPLFVRIAEPHHDGTPHWHTLIFVKPEHKDKLIEIMRHYALEHDGNERGAKESRFKYEEIDRSKGSAVGYIIKYIAKNIDGKNVGVDFESGNEDATDTVERVTAWARTWGIRQFQFSENCPVTIYRELRKQRTKPKFESMYPHWEAADRGDFCAFINAMAIAPMKLVTEAQQSTRYSNEQIEIIKGVELNGEYLETRVHTWVFRKKDSHAVPWTCVNNCTGFKKIKPFWVNDSLINGLEAFEGKYKKPSKMRHIHTIENHLQEEGVSREKNSTKTKAKVKRGYYYPNNMTRWSYFMQAIEPVSDAINEAFPQYHPMWIIRSQAKTANSISFKYLRQYILGITQKQCSAYLRVSESVVGKWESGKSPVPFVVYELLRLLSESVHFKLSNHEWQGWFIDLDGRLVSPDRGSLSFAPHELSFVRETHQLASSLRAENKLLRDQVKHLEGQNQVNETKNQNIGLLDELVAIQERLTQLTAQMTQNNVVSIREKKTTQSEIEVKVA